MRARWTGWVVMMLVAGTTRAAGMTPPLREPNDDARSGQPSASRSTASEPAPNRSLTDVSLPPELAPKPTPPPAQMSAEDLELRNRLLRKYVHDYVRDANWNEGLGYTYAAIGVLPLVAGAMALHEDRAFGITWLAGFGASTTAFGASLAASRDTRVDVLGMMPEFDFAVFLLGIAVAHDPYPLPRMSMAGASGALFVLTAFDATNAVARQTRLSTLRRERDRLDAGDVGVGELRGIEGDFLGTRVPLGPSMQAIPLGVGAVVSLVPAFESNSKKPERAWSIATGSLLGVGCLLDVLSLDPVSLYAADLNQLSLEFVASPTNVGFRYRF